MYFQILNLPLEIRGKYEYLKVYGILPGTKPADTTFLYEKLVDELVELRETGYDVWDAFSEEFVLDWLFDPMHEVVNLGNRLARTLLGLDFSDREGVSTFCEGARSAPGVGANTMGDGMVEVYEVTYGPWTIPPRPKQSNTLRSRETALGFLKSLRVLTEWGYGHKALLRLASSGKNATHLKPHELEKNGPPEWLAINIHKVDLLFQFGPVVYAFESMNAQTASFELKNFILGVDKASMACYTFNPWDTSNYTLDNKEPFILANQVQAKVMIVKYPCMDSAAILGTTDRNTEKLDRERIVMVDPLVVMVTLTHVESVGSVVNSFCVRHQAVQRLCMPVALGSWTSPRDRGVGYTRKMVIIARRDCGVPALTGLPCHHNVAHARFAGLDWQKFVDPLKTVAGWKAQYPLDLHFADVPNLTEAHGCA
eukprot:gene6521-biopygen6569